jgi:RNA polymerase sigma-70 factor (ECF subfamily)
MDEGPETRASLLVRIRDGHDRDAWRQFTDLYAPIVYRFGRRRGLQDADAADLMQEVLRSVAGAASRLEYDPGRGTFRGWLYTVTRNKLANFLNGRRRQTRGSGDSGTRARLEAHPDPGEDPERAWDQEYERRLFALAAERVRGDFQEATWQAFWLTAVEGKSAAESGARLGLSPGAVYVARSRVLARLRDQVRQMQAE